jgi:hypothetical protein
LKIEHAIRIIFHPKCFTVLLLFAALSLSAADVTKDLPLGLPSGMNLPERTRNATFAADDNRANFTFFDGVKDVAVVDGALRMTLAAEVATVGWGNYLGEQPKAAIRSLLPESNVIALHMRQGFRPDEVTRTKPGEGRTTTWQVKPWRDGKLIDRELRKYKPVTAKLAAGGWHDLQFASMPAGAAPPDGLEFVIRGAPGTTLEIEHLSASHQVAEGYVRSEFDLPEEQVWSAIANVISKNLRHWYGTSEIASTLYINGRKVARDGAVQLYHLAPVDIARYLKPGRNCIGFYGRRVGYSPPLVVQAKVVMADGTVVTVDSGTHWRYSPDRANGWAQPGFDDSAWQPVEKGTNTWTTARDFAQQLGLPHDIGPIRLRNPGGRWLFYRDDAPAVVEVRVPGGLAGRAPALRWSLGLANEKAIVAEIDTGRVETPETVDGALLYRLDLGKRAHGVYALALDLVDAGGEVIYQRSREPLVVLRQLSQKVVAGISYTEGLDLTLEDTVDFTDPDDPHPWHEFAGQPGKLATLKVSEPTIIRRDGLAYREIGSRVVSSGFSYRIAFQQPGAFYLMELDYPDDAHRITEVSITSKVDGVRFSSQSSAGVETGGKFFNTGKMQTLRWIHRADHGPHSVDILNSPPVCPVPAAAAKLRIYRINGNLPAVNAGAGRQFGIHNERQFYTNGFGRNFGMDRPLAKDAQKAIDSKRHPMQSLLVDLLWLKDATEHYAQYLRFTGQNTQALGCYQYTESNTPFIAAPEADVARVPWCPRSMLAHVFALNGITFYAGIEWSQFQDVRSYVNDAQVANGADTYNMIDAEGRQRYAAEIFTHVPNWLHPEIRARYRRLMEQVADTFAHLPNFRGVHGMIGPSQWGSGYWPPAYGSFAEWDKPLLASFDDVTIGLFEKDTGLEIPVDVTDPQRFQKRAAFLQNPAYKRRFLAWRTEVFTGFVRDAVTALREQRADLEVVNALPVEESHAYRYLHDSKKPFAELMRDFAIDMDRLNAIDGSAVGRWTISWRKTNDLVLPHQDPYCWLPKEDPDLIRAFAGARDRRYVLCRTSWHENHVVAGGEEKTKHHGTTGWGKLLAGSDWVQNRIELTTMPQPTRVHAREALIQAIISGDPNLLLTGFTDVNLNVGHEQAIRAITSLYTHLPPEPFAPALDTGLQTNVAIRQLQRDKDAWFYVANPGYWPVRGTVTLSAGGDVYAVGANNKVAGAGEMAVPIALKPFGLAVFRVASPDLTISGYEVTPVASPETEHLAAGIARVQQLLKDPQARLALSGADRLYVKKTAAKAAKAVREKKHALAWSLVKQPRYWTSWKQFLEKGATGAARLPAELGKTQATAAPEPLPELVARRAAKPIVADGKLDEAVWGQTPFATGFWLREKKPAVVETGIKAAYDDQHLYLAIACADRTPGQVQGDAENELQINAKRDDQIAIFIRPKADAGIYYQLAFNPKGMRFDQRVKGGERDYDFAPEWQTATQVGETAWVTEVVLPYKAFDLDGPQQAWRINVFRRFRNDELPPSGWSWTPKSWHNLERLGHLRFE